VVQIDRYVGGVWADHSPVSTSAATNTWNVTVFTVTTEPLFLSPFIYGNPEHNRQGMLGINNMAFTLNINSLLSRLISYAGPGAIDYLRPGVINDPDPAPRWQANENMFLMSNATARDVLNPPSGGPSILLRLLSQQPSDRLQTRNTVPFFDLPRYLTSVNTGAAINPGSMTTIASQAIQLQQLPDYFIICARKTMSSQTPKDTSSFLTIRNISINLNNMSGLLSSASPQDLWRLSVKNHSQQSWTEFVGKATVATADGQSKLVPTTGSLFIVSPTDLSIPDSLAPGSLGAFSFQAQVQVFSQFDAAIPSIELCVIACNSGILTIQSGTSQFYSGILTSASVELAKTQAEVSIPDRLVGGMLCRGMAVHPRLRGMVGSAMSAGAMSAGAVHSKLRGMY
jgi:hypothetical protein